MSLTPTTALKGVFDEQIWAKNPESLSKAMQFIHWWDRPSKQPHTVDRYSFPIATNPTPPENRQSEVQSQDNSKATHNWQYILMIEKKKFLYQRQEIVYFYSDLRNLPDIKSLFNSI